MISLYDIDMAVQELQRIARQGLRGALIWASPPDDIPYSSPHYDPFWAEAQELNLPISLHSITGHGPESRLLVKGPIDRYVRSTVLSHEVQRGASPLSPCPRQASPRVTPPPSYRGPAPPARVALRA
jgi:hypothetical protein